MSTKPVEAVEPTPKTIEQTATEFCAALSAKGHPVELIGAFHAEETRQGRTKDTDINFAARFTAFVARPA